VRDAIKPNVHALNFTFQVRQGHFNECALDVVTVGRLTEHRSDTNYYGTDANQQ
jgi:hypothetical protein